MAQAAADDPNTAPPTLEGSLGVVGPLRVRSYGNVKHAHVVLRKVDEVEYEDSSGRKRKRGVFSLFAHKIINVKAGKELFLYLHPVNGELQERSVALEGDLLSAEELTSSETTAKDSSLPLEVEDKVAAKSLERSEQKAVEKSVLKEAVKRVEDTESTDVEMKGVPNVQREQVLPPKMRKLWARKSMQALKANEPVSPTPSAAVVKPLRTWASVGVQAQPTTSSIGVHAVPNSCSTGAQTSNKPLAHVCTQTLPPPSPPPRVDVNTQTTSISTTPSSSRLHRTSSGEKSRTMTKLKLDTAPKAPSITSDSCANDNSRRSLSPMDMDSPIVSTPLTALSSPSPPPTTLPPPNVNVPLQRAKTASAPVKVAADEATSLHEVRKVLSGGSLHTKLAYPIHPIHHMFKDAEVAAEQPSIPTAPKAMKLATSVNAAFARHIPAPSAPRALMQLKASTATATTSAAPPPPRQTPPPPPPNAPMFKISIPIPRASAPSTVNKVNGVTLDDPSFAHAGSPPAVPVSPTPTSSKTTLEQVPVTSPSAPLPSSTLPTPVSVTDTQRPSMSRSVGSWSRQIAPTFVPATSLSQPSMSTASPGEGSRKRPLSPVSPLNEYSTTSDPCLSQTNKRWKKLDDDPTTSVVHPTPDPPPTEPEPAPPVYTDPIAAGWGRGLTVETASVDQLRALVNGALASARLIPGLAGTPITPSPISLPPPAPQAIDVPQCASALERAEPDQGRASPVLSEAMDIESDGESMQQSPPPQAERKRSPPYSPHQFEHISSSVREISIPYSPPPPGAEQIERSIKIEPREFTVPPNRSYSQGLSSAPQSTPPTQSPDITVLPPLHFTTGPPTTSTSQIMPHALPPKPSVAALPNTSSRTSATSIAVPLGRRFSLPMQDSAQIRGDSGIRGIVFSHSGSQFAVLCRDNTIRIWDNVTRSEIAKLAHSSSVISVSWMDDDAGVVSLGSNGVVSKWTKKGSSNWDWEKLLDAGDYDPSSLAYKNDCIAVANPRRGIKVWTLENGHWRTLERSIPRKEVTTVQFVDDGAALLCGASDGTVFYCSIPKCKVQPIATLETKVFQIDVDKAGKTAVISQASGRAYIIDINTVGDREPGQTLQQFSLRDVDRVVATGRHNYTFGAIYAASDNLVVYGSIGGRILVWDREKGRVKHQLDHEGDVSIQAIASFDGPGSQHLLLSGTRQGKLLWWNLNDD